MKLLRDLVGLARIRLHKMGFFSRKLYDIGICGRIAFFLIIPLIFAWVMFDPFLRIELATNTNEPQFISKSTLNENLTGSVLAEFFQTSLSLGWYRMCLENNGALSIGGKVVRNREDRGDITVQVKEVIPSPFIADFNNLSARPFEKADCLIIANNTPGIIVGTSTVSLGARINDLPGEIRMLSEHEFEWSFSVDFSALNLYVKQDLLAFCTKYLVMVFLWVSFVLFATKLWHLLTQRTRL